MTAEILKCQTFNGFLFILTLAVIGGILRKNRGK